MSFIDQVIKSIDERVDRGLRQVRAGMKSEIDPAYTSGNPKTKRPGESAAANTTKKVLIPYILVAPSASDNIVEIQVGDDTIVAGKIGDAPTSVVLNAATWGGQVLATPGNTVTHLSANTERSKTGAGADVFSDVKRFYLGVRGRFRISLELARSAVTTVQAKVQLELPDGTRVDCTTTASSTTNHPSFSSHNLDMTITANHEGMFLVVQYKNDNIVQTAYIRNVQVKYDEIATMPARYSVVITD